MQKIPLVYVHQTSRLCKACELDLSVMSDEHTCMYGDELRIPSSYSYVTDPLCLCHGKIVEDLRSKGKKQEIHIACQSQIGADGLTRERCTCGFVTGASYTWDILGDKPHPQATCQTQLPKGYMEAHREFQAHQDEYCSCYYELG